MRLGCHSGHSPDQLVVELLGFQEEANKTGFMMEEPGEDGQKPTCPNCKIPLQEGEPEWIGLSLGGAICHIVPPDS